MKAYGVITFLLLTTGAQAFDQAGTAPQGRSEPLIAYNPAESKGPPEAIAGIRELITSYQLGVRAKDAKKLVSFYLSDAVPVTGAFSAKSYQLIKAANKSPVPRFMPMNAKESVLGEVKQDPDKITGLAINTDGAVGTVSYDYSMAQGHGRILWSVLRSNEGWKIVAVVYSINVAAADK